MSKQRRLVLIGTVSVFLIIATYFVFNEFRFPFTSDPYGQIFNEERMRIGQPVIEPYFQLKSRPDSRIQTWYTPDSLRKRKFHVVKEYGTLLGKIDFETDYYQIQLDSIQIKQMAFDTLTYEIINADSSKRKVFPRQTFRREFYFRNDSIVYEIKVFVSEKRVLRKTLKKAQGDSIINELSPQYSN